MSKILYIWKQFLRFDIKEKTLLLMGQKMKHPAIWHQGKKNHKIGRVIETGPTICHYRINTIICQMMKGSMTFSYTF